MCKNQTRELYILINYSFKYDLFSFILAMITMLDDMMGQVVQALKERGMWENTLLLFLCDVSEIISLYQNYIYLKTWNV